MSHSRYIGLMVSDFENYATMATYRSSDLHINLVLALNVGGSGLLGERLLTRVRRIPPALALHNGLLQGIAVWTRLGKQDINFFESAAGGFWAVVPHVCSGEETADQWPYEDLGANSRNTSAATEDHDPSREPFARSAEATSDVTIAERSNLGTCQKVSNRVLIGTDSLTYRRSSKFRANQRQRQRCTR